LEELENIAEALRKKSNGSLPKVLTFQNYATLLTEIKEYKKAISVCELSLSYNLNDGTKSNYQGKIERIRTKLNT
jgi:beta-galactosidase GanA